MKDGPPRLPLRPDILFYFCKNKHPFWLAKARECCAAHGCPHLGAKPKKDFGADDEEPGRARRKPHRD